MDTNNFVTLVKNLIRATIILMLTGQGCHGQNTCSLEGVWLVTKGNLCYKYGGPSKYDTDRATFYKDSIELASGFFYNTMDVDDDYPTDRYPFVYYGNKEKYYIKNDTLYIRESPYQSWTLFEIQPLSVEKVRLIKFPSHDTVILKRTVPVNTVCKIESISLQLHKGSLEISNVEFKVTLTESDEMIFEQQYSTSESFFRRHVKLRQGTFKDICRGFSYIDLKSLQPEYPPKQSEIKKADIEINLDTGEQIRFTVWDIADGSAPSELQLALLPVLFLHQQFVYPKLPPKRW